jgi:molecular chaperone DnaK
LKNKKLQKALDENKPTEELKKLSEDLQQTIFGISQKAYEKVQKEGATADNANAQGGASSAGSSESSSSAKNDDDVIDAEYTKEN